ncbi:hypothetical protein [Nocardia abscessus]|uniref:hypothetical protein n=1 Tax=Nocardia abscessus TaxID=120957 RepID=UPI002453E846|nr:hypothetical protein [Nocardia abscessus]
MANGLNSLMRSIGTSISSAVVGVVLASTTQRMGSVEVPTLHGFRTSFLIAAGAALLGLVLAAFLPGRTRGGAGAVPLLSPRNGEIAGAAVTPLGRSNGIAAPR